MIDKSLCYNYYPTFSEFYENSFIYLGENICIKRRDFRYPINEKFPR